MKGIIAFVLALTLIFSLALADKEERVSVTAKPSESEIDAGEIFTIKVELSFKKGWYAYDLEEQVNDEGIGPMPTEITVGPENLLKIAGDIVKSKPKKKYDDGFETDIYYYAGKSSFEIPVKALKDIDFEEDRAAAIVYMQLCDETRCFPPEEFVAQISSEAYETGGSEGVFSFLWLAMTAGALALLTPCVFPMVPITVSFFANRAEKSKAKSLKDALVYALGIIVTFTFLGFLFSVLFGASGIQEFAKSPWVYMFIALIFIIFTLSFFGAYEIQLPPSLINKLDAKSRQGEGIISVLFMSLTFSLASFSCTGPLVGAALIAAASGEWFYPLISMLGFSAVLAAPFFLLALFPSALSSLPKSGGWMNNIKVVLGFLVLAATLYFVNNALVQWGGGLSRELFLSLWIACFALTALYILGVFKLKSDSPVESIGVLRVFFSIFFFAITFYLISGLFGGRLGELETYLPESANKGAIVAGVAAKSASPEEAKFEDWRDNFDEALAEAKKEQKPIFIDFTGKMCTNCKKMEKTIFPKESVKELLDKFVKVRLITDVKKEPYISNRKFQLERFNSVSIPLYVIMTPEESIVAQLTYTSDPEEFKSFLRKGLQEGRGNNL